MPELCGARDCGVKKPFSPEVFTIYIPGLLIGSVQLDHYIHMKSHHYHKTAPEPLVTDHRGSEALSFLCKENIVYDAAEYALLKCG